MKNQILSVIHARFINQPISRLTNQSGMFIICLLGCLALSRGLLAVNPPPDGGYPNGNTAEGDFALNDLTTGQNNVAVGGSALFNNLDGSANTAVGADALLNNTGGEANTALGSQTLFSNTTGGDNTATGVNALRANTTGFFNTATGGAALASNTTGSDNTATGVDALQNNTTGPDNTANGGKALANNTTGGDNTATGVGALFSNTIGGGNTATGVAALSSNTTGNLNTANGGAALGSNTTGNSNTANGIDALAHNTKGNNNIAVGNNAGGNLTIGNNNIDVGNAGVAGESNTIRLGKQGTQKATFIAGISGVAVSGSTVVVNSSGKLGVASSSTRFKEAIKPMDKASEAILALKPVSFRYKEEIDPDGIPQFGLVAEQVEKVNPDLVARDDDGKPYTVRYEAVNAMLLNEFLKEHKKAEQEARINRDQEREIATLRAALKEQAAQIQKVSHQLALSRPVPRIVSNNP